MAAQCRRTQLGSRVKRIETIEVGDWIWAWDAATGALVKRQIVRLFRHEGQPVLDVDCANDACATTRRLAVTAEHPFWVEGWGWVPAVRLVRGDALKTLDQGGIRVLDVRNSGRTTTVYNFEVDGAHNYFVGCSGVLVHNASRLPSASTIAPALLFSALIATPLVGPERREYEGSDAGATEGMAKEVLQFGYLLGVGDGATAKALASATGDVAKLAGQIARVRLIAELGGYDPDEATKTLILNRAPCIAAGAVTSYVTARAGGQFNAPVAAAAAEATAKSLGDAIAAYATAGQTPSFVGMAEDLSSAFLANVAKASTRRAVSAVAGPVGDLAAAGVKAYSQAYARKLWSAALPRHEDSDAGFHQVVDPTPAHWYLREATRRSSVLGACSTSFLSQQGQLRRRAALTILRICR